MDIKKQQLLLEYLVSSPDTFALCTSIVKSDYFDPELRNTVTFIQNYYDEYNSLPDPAQLEAETGRTLKLHDVTRDKVEYCATEVEKFCKRKAVEKAVLESVPLIENEDYGRVEDKIKEAITVSLNRDMGTSFFDDPEDRLKRLLQKDIVEPTGYKEVDDLLNGGLGRKQMLLLSANSGGGKSIMMANLGLNYVMRGHTVLLISLELSEEMIDMRYIQMVTGQTTGQWRRDLHETSRKISMEGDKAGAGSLHIKRLPQGSSANDFRAYLKEFELQYGKVPDMVIVDYLDLMGANEKVSADNVHEKDKRASEQLREIGEDYNAWVVTASQQNRDAVNATDLNHSHIAGGISKINTTDVYISVILTDKMRAEGKIGLQFLKTRSSAGVGKFVYLDYNPVSLRITCPHSLNAMPPNTKQSNPSEDDLIDTTGGLLGLMTSVKSR